MFYAQFSIIYITIIKLSRISLCSQSTPAADTLPKSSLLSITICEESPPAVHPWSVFYATDKTNKTRKYVTNSFTTMSPNVQTVIFKGAMVIGGPKSSNTGFPQNSVSLAVN